MITTFANRIQENTTTSGTGIITLNGATSPNMQTFSSGIGTGNSTYYCIQTSTGWEIGQGTVGGSGPYTLTRNLIASSTGNLLSLSGSNLVYCIPPAYLQQVIINPLWDVGVGIPLLSTFTQVGISGTTSISQDIKGPITISDTGANTLALKGLYTLAPTAPYRVVIMVQATNTAVNYFNACCGWTNGTSYKTISYWNTGISCDSWTSATSRNSYIILTNFKKNSYTVWFGLKDDGTNVYYEMSCDGVNFIDLNSETKSSGYLGSSGYSNIFLGICANNTYQSYTTFYCYDINGLTRTFL